MTQSPYTHKTKAKAKEQRFYCRSSSQNHKLGQKLWAPPCMESPCANVPTAV